MPLAPIKLGVKTCKPMRMGGALVFWRVEDAGAVSFRPVWRDYQAGFVRNRFHLNPPILNTFDFVPRSAGQVFYDFKVGITNLTIVVSGNITQMAAGDSVTVLIYPRGLPNQVAYSQTITNSGNFQVVWTPTKRQEWIVRVRANFNQTTVPITITNLRIERATGVSSGGDGQQPAGEPAFVFVG